MWHKIPLVTFALDLFGSLEVSSAIWAKVGRRLATAGEATVQANTGCPEPAMPRLADSPVT